MQKEKEESFDFITKKLKEVYVELKKMKKNEEELRSEIAKLTLELNEANKRNQALELHSANVQHEAENFSKFFNDMVPHFKMPKEIESSKFISKNRP